MAKGKGVMASQVTFCMFFSIEKQLVPILPVDYYREKSCFYKVSIGKSPVFTKSLSGKVLLLQSLCRKSLAGASTASEQFYFAKIYCVGQVLSRVPAVPVNSSTL